MKLRAQKHPKIETRDALGKTSGFLIPVYNVHDGFIPARNAPKQVYVTVCGPGSIKGPHLHFKRWGYLTCIKGNIRIVSKQKSGYVIEYSGESYEFKTIEVPPDTPAAIQNAGKEDAYVINTPFPAWHPDDQDEHEVVFEDFNWNQ